MWLINKSAMMCARVDGNTHIIKLNVIYIQLNLHYNKLKMPTPIPTLYSVVNKDVRINSNTNLHKIILSKRRITCNFFKIIIIWCLFILSHNLAGQSIISGITNNASSRHNEYVENQNILNFQ